MKPTPRWIPLPLYTQVLIAVTGGALFGVAFGQEPYLGCLRTPNRVDFDDAGGAQLMCAGEDTDSAS
jgi:hypothetical protein